MAEFTFTVPGVPRVWKRVQGGDGWRHTHPKDKEHRDRIRMFARNAGIRRPWHGAVYLACTFFIPGDPIAHGAPDRDNLLKSVQDALEGFAYVNDRQVCSGPTDKQQDASNPRTEITVREIP